ncbi:hypothetical protein GLOIN_2v1869804 [Rhizophagus irregularis DAOM 181602=DAOM 197198]|nr:hypothetical protein RirG_079810 [Rhizophagus irregularis DAOM 197198w]GBC52732.1 hypothetical protein GLOIN_2v1869804 [Rhizophagus irregularis DAOM 181602=DAOM 197198]
MDNFYNEFNQFKSRNVWINNTLTTKEQILNAKGRSYDNTFTLTENILKLLQRKGILCYRVKPVKVSDFNDELEKRLGYDTWKEIVCIFNRKINTEKTFKIQVAQHSEKCPKKIFILYFCYANSFGGLEQVYCKIKWTMISIGPCDLVGAQTCLCIGLHQQPSIEHTYCDFDASFPLNGMS